MPRSPLTLPIFPISSPFTYSDPWDMLGNDGPMIGPSIPGHLHPLGPPSSQNTSTYKTSGVDHYQPPLLDRWIFLGARILPSNIRIAITTLDDHVYALAFLMYSCMASYNFSKLLWGKRSTRDHLDYIASHCSDCSPLQKATTFLIYSSITSYNFSKLLWGKRSTEDRLDHIATRGSCKKDNQSHGVLIY